MDKISHALKNNVNIMRSKVSMPALYGIIIAIGALLLATLLSAYFQSGKITLYSIMIAQKTNFTLWILDGMPFVFAFWGQYISYIMAFEASAMVIDQTQELRRQAANLEHQAMHEATHDSLTDLPNRVLLRDRIEQAIHSVLREGKILALFLLDLDRFKEINDTLGHYNGDRLLKNVALRLKGMVRESDTLARLGGDEFAILLPVIKEKENVIAIVEKIQQSLLSPFSLKGINIDVQASIGIAVAPENGRDVDSIMQRADIAMYAAKKNNHGYAVYSPELDEHSPKRLTLMGELRQAIENNDLVLYYQPQIEIKTNKIVGVEALVRWQHQEHGLIPPDEFIPLAERTGLIRQLSVWVMKTALAQTEKWHESKLKLEVAINISPVTLLDPDLPETITGHLASVNLEPHYVTIEITEGTIIKDPHLAMDILNRLSAMGIKISIDDFGTGYSSLAYLKKLPVTELKIDKSFVMDMVENENDAVIVKSTIDLAHNMGLKVVAEGVENQEIIEQLTNMNCDILQGYHFSRPLSITDFDSWYKAYRSS